MDQAIPKRSIRISINKQTNRTGWPQVQRNRSQIMDNYDRFASEYDAYAKDAEDGRTEIELGHKVVARILGPLVKGKILDYGCGPGNFSRFLKSCGANVTGVDVSRKEIEIAKEYNDGVDYRAIQSASLDGLPADFDAVTFSFVLLTIPSAQEIVNILSACRNKIKRDGRLVILTANFEAKGGNFVSYAIEQLDHPHSGDPVRVWLGKRRQLEVSNYYWSKADYQKMLERSGLICEAVVEPVATAGEGWLDEREHAPCTIFVARPV